MTKYKSYTDEDIKAQSAKVYSLAGLLKALGLKTAGGNYANMKRNLQRLNVNTTHWKGQAWSKEQRLKDWSNYTLKSSVKKHLLKIRSRRCENCFKANWLEEKIPLEIHHKDGDRTNNEITNLKLLCPNCHALTKTWKGRNNRPRGGMEYTAGLNPAPPSGDAGSNPVGGTKTSIQKWFEKNKTCVDCGASILFRSRRCKSCVINPTKIDWPNIETLKQMIKDTNYSAVGRKLGVSDNAIRKRIKNHGQFSRILD